MTTRELLRDKLAPAVGRVLLKYAFGVDLSTIGGPGLDWLAAKFKKRADAKDAERFAKAIAERVVGDLVPVFEQDHSPDLNPEAVALALGDTLDQHVDGRFLVTHDLDPERLIPATFELPLSDLKSKAYGDSNIRLYGRALPKLIEALVPEAKQFGDFEVANAAEVLQRLRRLAELGDVSYAEARGAHAAVQEILAWLHRLTQAPGAEARAFEVGYVQHVENHLDDVQLVGITADPAARRQRLSKAYIPLSLSGERRRRGLGGPVYFETLLDALTPVSNRLLVIGAAGSGKTTLLRWAAIRAASMVAKLHERGAEDLISGLPHFGEFQRRIGQSDLPEDTEDARRIEDAWWLRVPFLIPLRLGTAGRLPELDEYPKLATNFPIPPPRRWVESILKAGRGLLLIDGIDEIPRADRPDIQKALEGLSALSAGNYVVFTTRPDVVSDDWFTGQDLLHAEVNPLSAPDRDQLIDHWHAAAADQLALFKRADNATPLATILREKLRRLPEIAQLATNPLLCASICALHYSEHGYLPKGQADLCEKLCEMLLERRDRDRKVPAAADREGYGRLNYAQKQVIVQIIAQDMIRAGEASIEADRVDQLIDGKRVGIGIPADLTTPVIRTTLAERSGLLREAYGGAIDFMHNTLRDYLAGIAFAQDGQIGELVRNVQDQSWRKPIVIAAAAGKGQFAQKLVTKLLGNYAKDVQAISERIAHKTRMRLLVAALCEPVVTDLGDLRSALQDIRSAILPPHTIEEAEALASLGDEIVALLAYVGERPDITRACVRALWMIGSPAARKSLEGYREDRRQEVAEELAFAFNPLELPFWQARVKKIPRRRLTERALPDAVARQVDDLAPLCALADAQALYLDGVAASDLTPIADVTGLQWLSLNNTAVVNLTPLAGLTGLQALHLNNTAVANLTPLAGLTGLQTLHLDSTAVADLTPLAGLTDLDALFLNNTAVADLTPLAGLTGLQGLFLNNTAVADLTPLAGLTRLNSLSLDNTGVPDLTPLAGLTRLQFLWLRNTAVAALTPVKHIKDLTILGP